MKFLLSSIFAVTFAVLAVFGAAPSFADGTGQFTGASNHITTGSVTVVKNADGTATVTLSADFSLDGAPDPRVGFGKDGAYVNATDLGELKMLNGAQTYTVPASVNVDDFNELYIWCLKFSVPLGVASLS
ncbi:MAG: DM13 domain-containing protein [Sulfitobacter sp.]